MTSSMKTSYNILITTTGLSSVGQGGGISSYVQDLATGLVSAGHHVTVYLVREGKEVFPHKTNYNYSFFHIPAEYRQEKSAVIALLDSIRTLAPDIIINNDVSYLSGLWPVLDQSIVKISVMHGFYHGKTLTNFGIQGKIACCNWPYVDYIVCQNQTMCREAAAKYRIPSDKFVCIHQTNWNQSPFFSEHKEKTQNSINLICACGQSKNKGAFIMRSLAEKLIHSPLKFHLNWCLSVSETWQERLQDPRISFRGNIPRDEFLQLLEKADAIIIPTLLDTGPMLVVEALSTGTIPICNLLKRSAIPDLIENGKNGFLIPDNKIDLYFRVIETLAENKTIAAFGKRCHAYFLNHLEPKKQLEQYAYLFEHKTETPPSRVFSDADVICFHLHNVSGYPRYSRKRIINKLLTIQEKIITYKDYSRFFRFILD